MLYFDWSNAKNKTNQKKHGLSFETAALVFFDPRLLSWVDKSSHYGEERWISLGKIGDCVIIVIHTIEETDDDEETIRIISARKASKKEQTHYRIHDKH